MSTIFSKIIKGDLPCYKLLEDEKFLAFLDIRPIARGHALVIPKCEIDKFFDVPEDILTLFLPFAKKVAQAIEKVVDCNRVGLIVAGLEVPHAHLHLVPINSTRDLDFNLAKPASPNSLADLATKIKEYL